MSIAIIAEYNPFHNGHIYQLNYAKKTFPNEEIIIIMSGKYVQRGELAIASFEERKSLSLKYGADKVYELPIEFTIQAAHIFAQGAIELINNLGIDKILFGSESNNCSRLIKIATFLKNNNALYSLVLKKYLKKGLSFPKANNETLKELLNEDISTSNDILALEYVKAIIKNDFQIRPYSLKRVDELRNGDSENYFASATKIREMIFNNDSNYKKYTPMRFTLPIDRIENYYHQFQKIIDETCLDELRNIKLISEGLETRFKKFIHLPTYQEFVNQVNSKRFTSSRIKRTILCVILNIKK